MKILHSGSNLPGVQHPDVGYRSMLNTTDVEYEDRLVTGAQASISFYQLTNWGENEEAFEFDFSN